MDKASAVLTNIGTKGKESLNQLKTGVARLPEQFGKSASAMSVLGAATSEMGGKTAMAMGKLSQIGSLIATGGPVGIAIAAATAAVGIATIAWEAHTAATKASEDAYKSLTGVMDERTARLETQRAAIEKLNDQIKYMGKTELEIQAIKLKDSVIGQTKTIPQYKEEIARMRELAEEKLKNGVLQTYTSGLRGQAVKTQTIYVQNIKEEADALNATADALERQLPGIEQISEANKEHLRLTQEKIAAEKASADAAKKSADVAQKKGDARKKAETERQALIDANEKREEEAQKRLDALYSTFEDRRKDRLKYRTEMEIKAGNEIIENAEKQQKQQQDALKKSNDEQIQSATAVGSTISGEFANAVESVIRGQATVEQAAVAMADSLVTSLAKGVLDYAVEEGIKTVLSAAFTAAETTIAATQAATDVASTEVAIGTASTKAMAESLAAYASIPFVGPALGAAQGAALVSAIEASRSLMAAERGLRIPGGGKGGESLVHTMRTDETVLDADSTRKWDRLNTALENSRGGMPSSRPSVTVNYSENTVTPSSSADYKRKVRNIARAMKTQSRLVGAY